MGTECKITQEKDRFIFETVKKEKKIIITNTGAKNSTPKHCVHDGEDQSHRMVLTANGKENACIQKAPFFHI